MGEIVLYLHAQEADLQDGDQPSLWAGGIRTLLPLFQYPLSLANNI